MKTFACLCFLVPSVALAQGFFTIPDEYESLNRPEPELRLVNPFFNYKGDAIQGVMVSVDDSSSEVACSKEDRNSDGKSCGEPINIVPGPHILTLRICTHPRCLGFGKTWTSELRITVGLRESLSLDIAKSATTEGDEDAISRKPLVGKALSPCAKSIESAFYVNTCTADGVKTFKSKLGEMDRICRNTWSKDTDLLFQLALWQASYVSPYRCYKSAELKKLPGFLVEWQVAEDFWPQGTIKDGASSWQWARFGQEGPLFHKYEGAALREKALDQVDRWYARQVVVDQLIQAALDPSKALTPLIDAARAAPWDLNPTTPEGHRDFALSTLAGHDRRFKDDPRIQELLARGAGGDTKIHCAYSPEVSRLIRSFLGDHALSADEWKAVSGFLARTPPDKSLRLCESVFRADLQGPVSQEERLDALAKVDCAANRDEKNRGTTLSGLLDPEHNATPKPLRLKMLKRYADCIAY